MNYYKIIQNNRVVGAGHQFLKWFDRVGMFCLCDIQAAQCVSDAITGKLYHPDWLPIPPNEAFQIEHADVQEIDANEYEEIIAELSEGEEIIVHEDEPEPEPEQEPEPVTNEEQPMSIAEMRAKIKEMEDVLNIIMGVVE